MTSHNGTTAWQRLFDNPWEGLGEVLLSILLFVIVLVVSYGLGRFVRWGIQQIRRAPPTAGTILGGKVAMLLWMGVVIGFGLTTIFDVDVLSVFATLGIVSLALGFGLQNTVANLAAGVGLSVDRPFEVGDRIQIGHTWGDVVSIGLRSTRILTTSGELVAVPNAVLDTQEVWNYTHQDDVELRLQLPFSISYESSVQLAASIATKIARRHERVLAYPEPRVQVKAMGDNGVELELRAWIDQARIRPVVQDRLYRQMLREFEQEGVIVPYPHEVQINAIDMPDPAPTPEFLDESEDAPLVLVATRGSESAQSMAASVLGFVNQLGARAIVLHVRGKAKRHDHLDADKAINLYMTQASKAGVKVEARSEVGDVAKVIATVAKEEGARLVILGQMAQKGRVTGWFRGEIAATSRACTVPVLPLQTQLTQSKEFVQRWHKRLRPEEEQDEAAPDRSDKAEKADKSDKSEKPEKSDKPDLSENPDEDDDEQ